MMKRVRFVFLTVACIAAATLEGAAPAKPASRTVIVQPTPGNPTASGSALLAAIASINPSSSDPWLIRIDPGVYDLGTASLQMKSFADVEGSGEGVTTIRGSGSVVVLGSPDSELRRLTVTNAQGFLGLPAIQFGPSQGGEFRVSNVTVVAFSNNPVDSGAVEITTPGSLRMSGSTISSGGARGINIASNLGSVVLNNVRISGQVGVGGTGKATIVDSAIDYNSIGIQPGSTFTWEIQRSSMTTQVGQTAINVLAGASARVAVSEVQGNVVVHTGATIVCVGDYSEAFAPRNSSCEALPAP